MASHAANLLSVLSSCSPALSRRGKLLPSPAHSPNCSLKRTAASRLRSTVTHCGSGRLAQALGSMRCVISSLLFMFASSALAGECVAYNREVTLRGTLSRHTFPEQPNYESIPNGDRPATYLFVSPAHAICVAAGNLSNSELAELQVTRVQIVFPVKATGYDSLRPYLGKQVECRGSLFHAMSGHHHSPVLLGGAKCHAA